MIRTYAYDVEVLKNFFSVTVVDLDDYLKVFSECRDDNNSPIPLTEKYTVKELKGKLDTVKCHSFYITDDDDEQLIPMLGFISSLMPKLDEDNRPVRNDLYGYNSNNYDRLMIAGLLMNANQCNSTKELITRLYNLSKHIIEIQDNKDLKKNDYTMNLVRRYNLPYTNVDVMTIFALNKCGKGKDRHGNQMFFPKSLKQTSINLKWYELLEYELPPITEKDSHFYKGDIKYSGMDEARLNDVVDKWDRYILPEWIPDMMHYNRNDVFIVCEMVRLYMDEIKLRYQISKSYGINALSSSRSEIANQLFVKFYSQFSGLQPYQWQGHKTERNALPFKRVIFSFIHFNSEYLQSVLNKMKQVVIYSVSKDSFQQEITINNLTYTIATGGLHSQDKPGELKSRIRYAESCSPTGELVKNNIWDYITDDSYIYVHFDIASFYPSIMSVYNIAPEHLNGNVFVKLITWLKDTRVAAKHSKEPVINGIPKKILAEALKIVINSIYGKLGYEFGDIYDRLAVLKVTINGQLMIIMLCERLEEAGIEIMSANTDGIVVKLYKSKKKEFDRITSDWMEETKLGADSEEYKAYICRDINNYFAQQINGNIDYKGALNPNMYKINLSKGYNAPIVAKAAVNFMLYDKPVLETLTECKDILAFCKTQNVGKQFHIELIENSNVKILQRNVRFYVSYKGGNIYKVNNDDKTRDGLCAGYKVQILNTLDDKSIEERGINYGYYLEEANKIIDPIKLGISPKQKGDPRKGTKSGKVCIRKYGGQYSTLFDDAE